MDTRISIDTNVSAGFRNGTLLDGFLDDRKILVAYSDVS